MKEKKQNESLFIALGVLIVLVVELSMLVITFLPKALSASEEANKLAVEEIVYSEKTLVNDLINSFNEELINKNLSVINIDYLTTYENTYYIGLFQDVILFITPIEFNIYEEDIVYQSGIIYDEASLNSDLALAYYKCLINANSKQVYGIDRFMNDLLNGKTIDNNNGFLFAKIENEDEINLVIERKYQD